MHHYRGRRLAMHLVLWTAKTHIGSMHSRDCVQCGAWVFSNMIICPVCLVPKRVFSLTKSIQAQTTPRP